MPPNRPLPKRRNPLLAPENSPEHEQLVEKRRLGQTNLTVKDGQVGTSNATLHKNLGMFNYAHLRCPLPENLKGSEIFTPAQHQAYPESYFLMRRSSDGYISATGMFKASFPWAKHAEEIAERDYIKSLPTTSPDEVAGNVWIPETYALELAEEYGIVAWIKALLDDAPVAGAEDPKKSISPPPKFTFVANDRTSLAPRGATPRGRGRPRASSPGKGLTAGARVASPRKSRATKATNAANAASTRDANASLQTALDNAASAAGSEYVSGDMVKVEVESAVEVDGDTETTRTNVRVEMPAGNPELRLPESTEKMIATAKEMVEEAGRLGGEANGSKTGKRKAEVLDVDDEEDEWADRQLQPAKRARLLEQELKKEKVRARALIGVAVTLTIGALMPYVI
ncbi:MAG: APSES transcription factor [Lasallia pustulata]|uniref:APSES transcription factor n=1 Tax=Lasallia pustulata TaxID=136370 RepID=A0A5M8PKD8_9LECA|nr:MAG: APSES transcription factor [Lasallia pustulata]